jgi:hypothetical protein
MLVNTYIITAEFYHVNLHNVLHVIKQDQQNATLHNGIYYYKCSTCFRQFLRPSSGALNCIHSIGYLSSFLCLLPLSWVSWNSFTSNSLTIVVRSRKTSTNIWCCVYRFELLMMGGGTAWKMQRIYSNKYHCVTLHLVGIAWINRMEGCRLNSCGLGMGPVAGNGETWSRVQVCQYCLHYSWQELNFKHLFYSYI